MHYGNLDSSIQGTQLNELFQNAIGNPFFVVNDADAAAIGIMEFGEGKNLNRGYRDYFRNLPRVGLMNMNGEPIGFRDISGTVKKNLQKLSPR